MEKSGAFDVKNKNQSKDTQGEDKIRTDLKNNNLSTDPLTVGVTKIIKNKIENSSTPDTSSEEIDDMLIKIMEEIEQEEELVNIMDSDEADDAIEDIENTIDAASLIDQTLTDENKKADQKLTGLKTSLGRAESEKKYLEEIIEAYEESEKDGAIQTEGIYSIKTRLEETNQTINNLQTEIEQYEDELTGEEDVSQDTSIDKKESEESVKEIKKAPTIELKTVKGPTFSEADNVCYYKVKAEVKGNPAPEIIFSRDDSGGAWGKDTVQINLKDGDSYTLKATAKNSEGEATDNIFLDWKCEKVSLGSVSLSGKGKMTYYTDHYNIKMNIDLDTGNITGSISYYGTTPKTIVEIDPETGEETKRVIYCGVGYNRPLSGSMNLDTRTINAECTGRVFVTLSGGECSTLIFGFESHYLSGTLNESATFASGTDEFGNNWSVSR